MPVKLTWKSIAGVLAILAGSLSQATSTLHLPASVSSVLIVIGGVIVAAERIADSFDNATASKVPPVTGVTSPGVGQNIPVVTSSASPPPAPPAP